MIAEVIIDSKAKKLNRKFDYKIPANLEDLIEVGSRVLVPFANFKTLEQGFVIKIKEKTNFEVKEIAGLGENLEKDKIDLARWMARRYFCNVSECIKLMLTPGTRSKINKIEHKKINFVYLNKKEEEIDIDLLRGEKQKKALNFIIKNQGMTIPEIIEFAGVSRETVNSLVKKDLIKIEEKKINRDPLINKNIEKTNKIVLNKEQLNAFNVVEDAIDLNIFQEFLLYGVTGSR